MCLDPGTLAIVTSIGTAISGGIQSIAAYSQEQQAVAQQNMMAMRQDMLAQQQFQQQRFSYEMSERAYQDQIKFNSEAANRAYVSEQNKLRAEQRKASEEAQQLLIQSMQRQGTVLASGRTGQSIGLLAADAEREYGRDLAMLGQNLAYANEDYLTTTQDIFRQAESANVTASMNRQLSPVAPMATPMVSGPSGLGLIAGLGGAALSGLNTYASLKPPKATGGSVPRPTPIPTPKGGSSKATYIKWS
jgi:hypothetical protein